MKRSMILVLLGFMSANLSLWAIPTEINYQGTLKSNGLPYNDSNGNSTRITFTLTSSDGQTPYSSAVTQNVPVSSGLFSTKINFQLLAGNSWESITPYIKVNVNGQDLGPPEKLSANVYSIISSSVVAGAINPGSIVAGYGLVPSNMIAIFPSTCPQGWNVYAPLNGKYPVGADGSTNFTLGVSTGTLTHNHRGQTGNANRGSTVLVGTPGGAPNGQYLEDVANQPLERVSPHSHDISMDSSLPPTMPIVFCQKQ